MNNQILPFLQALSTNNNRDWFTVHKAEYGQAKIAFEQIVAALIARISRFDKVMANLNVEECTFRIYRDIRFSYDKTPYKTHFGAYIAYPGGRKSERAGYYLHITPTENCFFAAGVWSPRPHILKALRQSIFDNYDEFQALIQAPAFKRLYADSFYKEDKLKRMPIGFPSDFVCPELLMLKHYLVSHKFSAHTLTDNDLVEHVATWAEAAYPFLQFLNHTIDEII